MGDDFGSASQLVPAFSHHDLGSSLRGLLSAFPAFTPGPCTQPGHIWQFIWALGHSIQIHKNRPLIMQDSPQVIQRPVGVISRI